MQREFELKEWLMLIMSEGVGPESVQNLLRAFGSPKAVRYASVANLEKIIPTATAQNIKRGGYEKEVEFACQWATQSQCHIITLADTEYPPLLLSLNTKAQPPLLYIRGNLDALTERPLIAIVGSSSASAAGVDNAENFARKLSESGVNIVSGMEQGIDSAAHRGALQGGGNTVAVVSTGVDIIYPKQSRTLAMDIVAHGGAIVSDLPLATQPHKDNLPRRNRIISGLARGCLVVEATLKSRSLSIARLAADQGRDVFAAPGHINTPMYRGCHALIKKGEAKLTDNVDDIFEELNIKP